MSITPTVVFFDIGSTLIDGPTTGPGKRLAQELGLGSEAVPELTRLLFTSNFTDPDDLAVQLADKHGLDRSRTMQVVAALWRSQIAEARPIAGAMETLERVAAAGYCIAYISNIWQPFYAGFVRCFPSQARRFPGYLSFRLGSMKPAPALFEAALAGLECRPHQAVMIGDTYKNDIAPARALGLSTVWLLHRPHKEAADLIDILNGKSPAPDLTLKGISDLQPEAILGSSRIP